MCRWLAYIGAPRLIEEFVYDGARALCGQAQHSYKAKLGVHGDGGGLGWYGDHPEPGLYRNPGPAWADPNLRELTRQIRSRVFFAHVRASTGAPNLYVNCHPFRSGEWLFMHNGQIGGFSALQRRLEGELGDAEHAALLGGTDSELMFQLMITNGLKQNPEDAIRSTITGIERLRREAGVEEPFRATFAVTDGRRVWAVRWSSDDLAPSLYVTQRGGCVLLASEPLDEDLTAWRALDADQLVHATAEGGYHHLSEARFLGSEMKDA